MKMYPIKRLETLRDITDIQSIEQKVWNMSPIPIHQTYTAAKNGGIILGAYDHGELIGFLYSFSGFKNGAAYLCSHMLGIVPDYQKGGLGKKMKDVQRQIAIKEGYDLIVWTFDPLESVNAYLNLHKLKGIGAACFENHYGSMEDALNQGMPTDRFLVEWWIRSPHVSDGLKPIDQSIENLLETQIDSNGFPIIVKVNPQQISKIEKGCYAVAIPDNFQTMKKEQPELAYDWRMQTREVFQTLFANGYVACDIRRDLDEKVSTYIFNKREDLSL